MEEIFRIIDANLNRASEGLRVVEEVARFIIKDEKLTKGIRVQRHKLGELFKDHELIKFRDTSKDLGKHGDFDDGSYKDLREQVQRNLKRAQEGCRVIEEFSKLFSEELPPKIKEIRFNIYELEKELINTLNNKFND